MTYRILRNGAVEAECHTHAELLLFLHEHRHRATDGAHVTTDGDLLIRMGNGYTIEKGTPKIVRLPHCGRINEGERPA